MEEVRYKEHMPHCMIYLHKALGEATVFMATADQWLLADGEPGVTDDRHRNFLGTRYAHYHRDCFPNYAFNKIHQRVYFLHIV